LPDTQTRAKAFQPKDKSFGEMRKKIIFESLFD